LEEHRTSEVCDFENKTVLILYSFLFSREYLIWGRWQCYSRMCSRQSVFSDLNIFKSWILIRLTFSMFNFKIASHSTLHSFSLSVSHHDYRKLKRKFGAKYSANDWLQFYSWTKLQYFKENIHYLRENLSLLLWSLAYFYNAAWPRGFCFSLAGPSFSRSFLSASYLTSAITSRSWLIFHLSVPVHRLVANRDQSYCITRYGHRTSAISSSQFFRYLDWCVTCVRLTPWQIFCCQVSAYLMQFPASVFPIPQSVSYLRQFIHFSSSPNHD